MAKDTSNVIQLITCEEFDPIQARFDSIIKWFIEYYQLNREFLEDEDEFIDQMSDLINVSHYYHDLAYPEEKKGRNERIKDFLLNHKKRE